MTLNLCLWLYEKFLYVNNQSVVLTQRSAESREEHGVRPGFQWRAEQTGKTDLMYFYYLAKKCYVHAKQAHNANIRVFS